MKNIKSLSTRKPPVPDASHGRIDEWIANSKPAMNPIISELDKLIRKHLKDPRYAVKWGKAYYGSAQFGWCIELAAYHVSVNVVFLNGGKLDNPPDLGNETRYVKIRGLDEAQSNQVLAWVKQSCQMPGWAW
ncbi:MAG: DUF1801 domain-containing protein [Gammaproteobacteria bacterium]